MPVDRNKIVEYCREYLKVKNYEDFCVNGLQLEGINSVNKIITGVSLSQKLINAAVAKKAQLIIVHHGLFGDQIDKPPQIKGYIKNRLKLLMENYLNLCGFHLPLDAHPVIGNNISLAKLFKLKKMRPFYVGFIGELKNPMEFKEFIRLVNSKLATKSYFIAAGPKMVKKIGIVSGGAAKEFKLAAELGADTYVCGDIRESIVEAVRESRINYINAGHYNTEKLGIRNLGNLVAKKFKIKVEFIDLPNEI